MQSESNTMTIGGLAKPAGINVETVRFYQRRGLLHEPERPFGGIRRYGRAELVHACHEREGSISWPLIGSLHEDLTTETSRHGK